MKPIEMTQLKDFLNAGGTWEDLQRAFLVAALDLHQGNRTYAAKSMGVSIRTVRNRIKYFDLKVDHDAKAKGK